MSPRSFVYRPKNLPNRRMRMRLSVDLPGLARRTRAIVTTYRKDGGRQTTWVKLNEYGNGGTGVPFSSSTVGRVEVTLVKNERGDEGAPPALGTSV